jgi:hypothetical protein
MNRHEEGRASRRIRRIVNRLTTAAAATIAALSAAGSVAAQTATEPELPGILKPGMSPPPAPPSVESPAPAVAEPAPRAGYFGGDGGGFVMRTEDGSYRLRIGLQSDIRGGVNIQDGTAQVANPFMTLRPIFEGNLYKKWIRFWTSLELASNPTYLLDSYVEIQPWDLLGVRLGQQWTPFSRHEAISGPADLLLPDWDVVADYFWSGRDKGVTLFGATPDETWDYALGAYIGSPLRQFETIRGNYLVVARLAVNPLGPVGWSEYAYTEESGQAPLRLAVGVNGYASKVNATQENFNPSTFKFETTTTGGTTINQSAGADFFILSPQIVALVEGYLRRTDPGQGAAKFSSLGGFAQLGVLLYKREVDANVRFSMADVNLDASNDLGYGIEVGGSFYVHAPTVVLKLRYGYGHQQTPSNAVMDASGTTSSGGAPLILSPGSVHVMTLQLNTAL